MERWLPVPDWPEYEVSDLGRIRRATPGLQTAVGRVRKPNRSMGYQAVRLTRPGGYHRTCLVHRLVARAFLGEPPHPDMQVNHKDSDRWNAALSNLEWVTRSGNIQHGYDHGHISATGSKNGYAKLTEEAVAMIRERGASCPADKKALAAEFSVSYATIHDVLRRRIWKHVA